MQLTFLDWSVLVAYFAVNLGIGLYYRRKATGSTDEFFVGGRKVSWWLAGTSMVATTYAADTPLAVTGIVAANGIAGNWIWWNMLLSGMLTVFFFARLWRRAGVTTDVEFAELRYSGRAAAFLRGFRALYLGLPVNCIVMGWVNLAMVKILLILFPALQLPFLGIVDPKLAALVLVFGLLLLTALISSLSGLWGVLVTDLFQFVLMMSTVIALAFFAVRAVGGMEALQVRLDELDVTRGSQGSVLNFFPQAGSAWMPPVAIFVYLAVVWWATWYPGAEPGGGGYVAQRIFCARDERHSLLATLWFTVAHYALRPWPWIITALVSLVLYPDLADKEAGFVQVIVDPKVLPPALAGLMIAALVAAYMSTVATQLNWGASYLVNDLYRRFCRPGLTERHYVRVGQAATLLIMLASCVVTYFQDSIAGAWKFLMAVGAGTGSVFILRWFWWRINAWSEVSAMLASFVLSLVLQLGLGWNTSDPEQFAWTVLVTVLGSTVVWLATTLLTAPESESTLLGFYRKVRPSPAFGWRRVAAKAPEVVSPSDTRANLANWALGCGAVYLVLFGTGQLLLGSASRGLLFLAVALVAAVLLYRNLGRRGWTALSGDEGSNSP